MKIELRLLRHARTLAEHGHFGRAAQALRLTQPALSRSIAELERALGTRLFERGRGGVRATDAGLLLLDRARDVLARADDLGRELEALRGLDTAEIALGAGTYPAGLLVGRALAAMAAQRPGTRVTVTVDNVVKLLPGLRRRELDIVVGDATQTEGDPDLEVTPLAPRQGYLLCRPGHPLAATTTATLADILQYPLVSTSRLPPRLLAPFAAASRQPDAPDGQRGRSVPAIACESLTMMKAIAMGSDAVALLPLAAASTELRARELVVLPLVEPWLAGQFAIIRLARRVLPPSGEELQRLLLAADAEVTRLTDELAATTGQRSTRRVARPTRPQRRSRRPA